MALSAKTVSPILANSLATPQHRGLSYQDRLVGKWTVLADLGYNSSKRRMWRCRCSCGDEYTVQKDNIMAGKSKGCQKCHNRGNSNPAWSGYKDIPGHVFGVMKRGAQLRHLECQISMIDLQEKWEQQRGLCALSGLPISIKVDASIDRIDSQKGYTRDNIQWVHNDVNLMKNHFDQTYFIEMCRRIAYA